MLLVTAEQLHVEVEACRACAIVWLDLPTYEILPKTTVEMTNSVPLLATEIIAMNRLRELKEREAEQKKKAKKRKQLHRITGDETVVKDVA